MWHEEVTQVLWCSEFIALEQVTAELQYRMVIFVCYIDIHSNSNYCKSLCLGVPCINCAGEKTLNKKCGRLKRKK